MRDYTAFEQRFKAASEDSKAVRELDAARGFAAAAHIAPDATWRAEANLRASSSYSSARDIGLSWKHLNEALRGLDLKPGKAFGALDPDQVDVRVDSLLRARTPSDVRLCARAIRQLASLTYHHDQVYESTRFLGIAARLWEHANEDGHFSLAEARAAATECLLAQINNRLVVELRSHEPRESALRRCIKEFATLKKMVADPVTMSFVHQHTATALRTMAEDLLDGKERERASDQARGEQDEAERLQGNTLHIVNSLLAYSFDLRYADRFNVRQHVDEKLHRARTALLSMKSGWATWKLASIVADRRDPDGIGTDAQHAYARRWRAVALLAHPGDDSANWEMNDTAEAYTSLIPREDPDYDLRGVLEKLDGLQRSHLAALYTDDELAARADSVTAFLRSRRR